MFIKNLSGSNNKFVFIELDMVVNQANLLVNGQMVIQYMTYFQMALSFEMDVKLPFEKMIQKT